MRSPSAAHWDRRRRRQRRRVCPPDSLRCGPLGTAAAAQGDPLPWFVQNSGGPQDPAEHRKERHEKTGRRAARRPLRRPPATAPPSLDCSNPPLHNPCMLATTCTTWPARWPFQAPGWHAWQGGSGTRLGGIACRGGAPSLHAALGSFHARKNLAVSVAVWQIGRHAEWQAGRQAAGEGWEQERAGRAGRSSTAAPPEHELALCEKPGRDCHAPSLLWVPKFTTGTAIKQPVARRMCDHRQPAPYSPGHCSPSRAGPAAAHAFDCRTTMGTCHTDPQGTVWAGGNGVDVKLML